MPPILVLGSINMDLVVRAPRLPKPGETVGDGQFFQSLGGKGANQAVAAARAGRNHLGDAGSLPDVALIAAVGNDVFGRAAREALGHERLLLDHVRVISGRATGTALIVVDAAGENQIAVAGGANDQLTSADIDALPDGLFASAKLFLACLETPVSAVAAGLRRARKAGAITILNPAPASPAVMEFGMLHLVDVLTPNAQEASTLSGTTVADIATAAEAGRKLIKQGCGTVAVTLGTDGAVIVDDSRVTHVPTPQVTALDTTAAGDAFNGALAVALVEGKSLAEAARFACRAAAISVTRLGAQLSLPTRAEIDAT